MVRRTVIGLMMSGLVAIAALAPSIASAAQGAAARIRYYESFSVVATAVSGSSQKAGTGTVRKVHFSAYGRRFDLALEKNSRLEAAVQADASGPTQSLYRGVIENVPGSWVRLSAKGQIIRGMIWDGQDLYIAELADVVRDSLEPSLPAPAAATVIFKLSDAVLEKEAAFCATPGNSDARGGSDAYKSLVTELKGSPAVQWAAGAQERLELSIYGDSQFLARWSQEQEARDEIRLLLNNVDGIFSSQLGIELQVPTMMIATPETESLSDTTVPSTLLNEIRLLRRQTPELYARGLTHLFTGRDLDSTTVGIAYRDTLCSREYGAAVTEASGRGPWIESLIAAHEIGHNFGAYHDGDAECDTTPTGQFLMSSSVNSNASTFSECSLQTMRPRAQAASCIVALPPADLSVPYDLGTVQHTLSTQFAWDLTVVNAGGAIAVDSQVELVVPPAVLIDDAWVAGGTCTSGAGTVSCVLGEVPGSASRVIHLTLHSDVVGTNSISARVSAQNDAQAANDTGDGTLVIEAAASSTPATPNPSTNSLYTNNGGGGGGSTSPVLLFGLLGMLCVRQWRALRRRTGTLRP